MTDIPFEAPLVLHRESVRPEWIDYNGHMNVAFYVMAFDHATDVLFDVLGIGAEYCRRENCSVFAVEQHIAYKRELKQGENLIVSSQLLGFDDKRLHFFQRIVIDIGGRFFCINNIAGSYDFEPAGRVFTERVFQKGGYIFRCRRCGYGQTQIL